jgi:hypothetical membrane protein
MTRDRLTALLGIIASIVFFVALAAFGALDPAYSHATKAVSELGATGAENQLGWNLAGFLTVGILLAVFGWRLGSRVGDRAVRWLLTLFGLAFAATAIPADMGNLRSSSSTAHIAASLAVFLFWALGALRILLIDARLGGLKWATGLALTFAGASVLLRASELLLPGLAQRVSFLVVFGWVIAASVLLARSDEHSNRPSAPAI